MSSNYDKSNRSSLIEYAGGSPVILAIVFTDVVGSAKLGQQIGDQRMVEVRRAFFERSETLITHHRGCQVKTIGDSVMAVFRSVRDALNYALALHRDPGAPELRTEGIRAGIHTGEVDVVEGDVFGREVDFTSRVMSAAKGPEIWLSGRAREAIDRGRASHQAELTWHQHDNVELKDFDKTTLWSLNPDHANGGPLGDAAAPATAAAEPEPAPRKTTPTRTAGNGRTVFVARPASDMGDHYVRIVDELKERGYTVVPDDDIPNDERATAFIDSALAQAEMSIHLLGERPGITPDAPDMTPIGKLQLARAGLRAEQAAAQAGAASGFRRIVWAPKVFEGEAAAAREDAQTRNPIAVLERFDEHRSVDKVHGENLFRFIDALHEQLEAMRPPSQVPTPEEDRIPGIGDKIFIDHSVEDYEYATELALALQELSFEPRFTTTGEGNEKRSRIDSINRKEMLDCSAVAFCWGNASEVWLKSEYQKICNWRSKAKRDQINMALFAGPPPDRSKDRHVRIKLPGIDRVVDLRRVENPSPDVIRDQLWSGSGANSKD